MAVFVLVIALVAAAPALAQMQSRPTDAPVVNASAEAWYRLREPLQLGGDVYYPAGASVFFNGHVMVRTGHYNGVPLYADATLEPHSIVYVPIGRGQMQPYERPRRGVLAGSVGSRLSAFPVRLPGEASVPMTATAPTQLPYSLGAIASFTPDPAAFPAIAPPPIAVTPIAPSALATPTTITTTADAPTFVAGIILGPVRPESNDGVWLQFDNQRWVPGGRAEAQSADLQQVGTHAGFPVLRRPGAGDVIYLPSRDGLVVPYRRKS